MSIAWSGIVLLVLLLPGFLFFVGLYFPEKFTREVVERSPLTQLAGTVLIAVLVHGCLYLLNRWTCGAILPCIDLTGVLGAIALDASKDPRAIAAVGRTLTEAPGAIFLYVLTACALGMLAGWGTGSLVVKGPFRFLVQHRWVYDLKIEDGDILTVAYVLSRVSHGKNHLLYRGFLKAFGLQKDGRFSYLILTNVVRYYLALEDDQPVTTRPDQWIIVGETTERESHAHAPTRHGRRRDRSYFAIEGTDIANVIFDRYTFPFKEAGDLDAILKKVQGTNTANARSGRPGDSSDTDLGETPVSRDDG